MHRFAFFVDGSNLSGSLKNMNVQVDDYEKFYRFIFDEAIKLWRQTIDSSSTPPTQLYRIYWYTVGSMDEWDLSEPKVQVHLRDRFLNSKDAKNKYLAMAGQKFPGQPQEKIETEAWSMCFNDFKEWYDKKINQLRGMQRFYHAVRTSTDFIDIIECGHWKVDFTGKSLSEKGVDTSLAVDMLAMAENYDIAILVSGDADSIPSIKYMKHKNKHVAVVEFLPGYPPAKRGSNFSSHLKLTADFVVRIYEMDLVSKGVAQKASNAT